MSEPTYNDLLDLIRWECLRYGDNEPVFATRDWQGNPLPEGERRQATFRAIFGEKRPTPGEWRQCPECRQWYVHSPGSDRKLNGHDIEELRKMVQG